MKDRAEALGEADGDAEGDALGLFDGLALGDPGVTVGLAEVGDRVMGVADGLAL